MKIIVEKSARKLTAGAFSCGIGLGSAPIGHKLAEGDGKTPEGRYYVCTKNAASKFHLALGVSYPNEADAETALSENRISREQFSAIRSAQQNRRRPPWDTPLGGFIMIHGEHPDGKQGDWTAGCIALTNADIETLFSMAQIGDEIEILP